MNKKAKLHLCSEVKLPYKLYKGTLPGHLNDVCYSIKKHLHVHLHDANYKATSDCTEFLKQILIKEGYLVRI